MADLFTDHGIWVGEILDVRDPNESGKMQVDIHGHTNIGDKPMEQGDLPWAIPIMNNEPSLNKIGSTTNYLPGTTVFGHWTKLGDGEEKTYYITGSIPKGRTKA
jgi:hypothetical protein